MEKLDPDTFPKNQNWAYLMINSQKFDTLSFYSMSKSRSTKIYGTDNLIRPHIKLFLKTKRSLVLVSQINFLHYFWRKIFFTLHSLTDRYSLSTFLRYWAEYVCSNLLSSWWRHKSLKLTLAFLKNRFPKWPKKVSTNI